MTVAARNDFDVRGNALFEFGKVRNNADNFAFAL